MTVATNALAVINEGLNHKIRKREVEPNIYSIADWLDIKQLPATIFSVPKAIEALYDRPYFDATTGKTIPALIDSQRWCDACVELRQARGMYQFNEGVYGLIARHIDDDRELSSMAVDVDTLVIAFDELNAKYPFSPTRAYVDQQNEIAERQRLIAEISNGRTDFYEAREGGSYPKKWPVADLHNDTIERLREIHGIVMAQRELQNMDSKQWLEQKRKEGIRKAQEAAGMTKPERELPTTWIAGYEGEARVGERTIQRGDEVELTARNIMRMNKEDLRALINKFGAAALDKRLGVVRK